MQQIKILATDFDDTLVGNDASMLQLGNFKKCLSDLRLKYDTKWVIVTGRPYKHIMGPVGQFKLRGYMPDYIVTSECYIYKNTKVGYVPKLWWNFKMWHNQKRIVNKIRKVLKEAKEFYNEKYPDAVNKAKQKTQIWVEFEDVGRAIEAHADLKQFIQEHDQLQAVQIDNEVYVMATYFSKGLALNKIAELSGVDLYNVMAIGDGMNDISMLNGDSAGMVACVANANETLKHIVQDVENSLMCTQKRSAGVVEAIEHFMQRSL